MLFWSISILLCLILLASAQNYLPDGLRDGRNFIYNNTYRYDTVYTIVTNSTTEYVLEFFENNNVASGYPARVTVSSQDVDTNYPLFIAAGQQKGVLSWQLPMVVETKKSSEQFSSMSRTLCLHDHTELTSLNQTLIHLSTSSPNNVTAQIKVECVDDFYIELNTNTELVITPSTPKYYYYSFEKNPNNLTAAPRGLKHKWSNVEEISIPKFNYTIPKSVILIIESDDDVCALVSIQNYSCPVFDNEREILYEGYYLTMMRKGGITLTQSMFPNGFYIVFIVKASDEDCRGVKPKENNAVSADWDEGSFQYAQVGHVGRIKKLRFKIVPTISYEEYLIAALLAFGFYLSFYLLFIMAVLFCRKKHGGNLLEPLVNSEDAIDLFTEDGVVPVGPGEGGKVRRRNCGEGTSVEALEDDTHDKLFGASLVNSESESSLPHEAEEDSDLPQRLTLADLARNRGAVLAGRSDKYLWNVITVSVFYALPVIQLVISYQGMLIQTGNQDLCYYNFLCAHPLGFLSDFNHVYSNLGYVMLGALFLMQVRRRQRRHVANSEYGIPQHFGLFYSMGWALMMVGLLSGSYHFCPNKMNFQFDSSFMYVVAVLCIVKIYQTRHPDINARAHSTFGVLACILFIGLFGILNASLYFWVGFTILHLITCLVLTFRIYYMGRFRLKAGVMGRAYRELRRFPRDAVRPHYRARFVLLLLANAANWLLAAYGLYNHKKDFAVHLLAILMGNTILYTLFYFVMKLLNREPVKLHTWLFLVLAHVAWFSSLHFFLDSRTKWSLMPAESRRYNQQCNLLDFYDYHDIWHFLSAIAMFLSFNLLLSMDDGLSQTPRKDIGVF